MTPERWKEIEKIFYAALDIEPQGRAAFLDEACGDDAELRKEVDSLLSYEKPAVPFIESPALEVAAEMIVEDQKEGKISQRIGPYQVLSFIGAGGMGEVHLAQDIRLGRKVALKLLPEQWTKDSDSVRRFEREARAASALNHPNILTIYDIGHAEGIHYIATEFIEGETLRYRMISGKMDLEQILDVSIQTSNALATAHEAGIIHRDIKPENIMLRRDGLVKVLDFGLAKLIETPKSTVNSDAFTIAELKTETGIVVGTARYMSPEQARGQTADARTDLFSLGIVMYEMIASRPPFTGDSTADVITALLSTEPPLLSKVVSGIPASIDSIVHKALRKDSRERYQSARDLFTDLRNVKQNLDLEVALAKARSDKQTIAAKKPQKRQRRKAIDSLAVLPIVHTGIDPSTEYLSDGITEGIITALSHLPKLRVMAWSTVSQYKNERTPPLQIAQQLGVRAVLTGRIVQMTDRLIVKTELVDAIDGSQLWGEQYSLQPSDVFEVEEKIAKEISEKLLLRLTGEEKQQLKTRHTDNIEAYHAYLRGRYYWNKRTDEDVRKAIEHFRHAIDLDPVLAPAYSGLADAYLILGTFGIATMAPKEAFPKAKEAAIKALEIEETLAEPHASLGNSLAVYDWNWAAAEKEFKRSMELKPNYATAHHWYGMVCLAGMGKLEEGIKAVRKAHELDPLSLSIGTDVGLMLYFARRYDEAIEYYRNTLEMDRNFAYAHWKFGLAYEQKQMYAEAIGELQQAIALSGKSALPLALLGHTYAVSGNRTDARDLLQQLNELSRQGYVSPYRISLIYAALDEMDEAFLWLDRALEARDGWLIWLKYDPVADPLRSDPRFSRLLRAVSSVSTSKGISVVHSENIDAYHAYLKGRYFWNKRTTESLNKGVEYFNKAIELDPSYAAAYAGLSDSYTLLVVHEGLPPREGYSKAKEAAIRAIEIDDGIAEAHASLAHALLHNWEWTDAEKEFDRAMELNPGYAPGHHWYSEYLLATGRLDEALKHVHRAKRDDPLSLIINAHLAHVLYFSRRYDEAVEQCLKTIEMDPNFFDAQSILIRAYVQQGKYDSAFETLARVPDNYEAWLPSYLYAASGQFNRARTELENLSKQGKGSPCGLAFVYAALGQRTEAFRLLDQALQSRDAELFHVRVDPMFDPLRSDSRFSVLLQRMGLELPGGSTIRSIAVLPFKTLHGEERDEYLELGLADALITRLTGIQEIAVRPTSAVRKYADSEQDSISAGKELKVEGILEGSLQTAANRLRVTARLVHISSGRTLWADKLDQSLTDIFEVEDIISEKIVSALALSLRSDQQKRLTRRSTENAEAYQAYLKGRYFWYKRTEEDLRKGIEFFQRAIEEDPAYAAAYAGLSDSYALLALRGIIPAKDTFRLSKAAARKALEIDDSLGEAYASLAHVRLHDWDWDDLEKVFKRAIDLNPGHAITYHWYSEFLIAMGRPQEAIEMMHKAQEIDPISSVVRAALASACYFARMYDRAIDSLRSAVEFGSDHMIVHLGFGNTYLQTGKHQEAIEEMQKAVALSGRSTETLAGLGQAYAFAGKKKEMEEVLNELLANSSKQYVSPYNIAKIYAAFPDIENAFLWLEKAYEERNPDLIELKVEPILDSLRADKRFDELLQRVGLTPKTKMTRTMTSKAIAVLPFKPLNTRERDEYLELGMADALITKLSDLTQLVVRPTGAIRKYMDLEQDPVKAGHELKVESVLEGSIQKIQDRIRVTARLIQVGDGRSLWTGKFDENFTDIFALQDSLSEKIAVALALKLTEEQKEQLAKRYTENPEAYQLYLKGRYYWNKRAEGALHKSIECFNRAIEIDPNFALAYAGLGDSYTYLGDAGITAVAPKEAFAKGKAAAAKALEIDETLAEAHAVMGHLHLHFFQWGDAEKELRRTIQLKPNYPTVHEIYSYYLLFIGKVDEALAEIERALELDPLSEPINADVGDILYFARRYDQALEQMRKVIQVNPLSVRARLYIARVLQQKKMHEEAIAEFQKAVEISGRSPETVASLAHGYGIGGRKAEAMELLRELNELGKTKYVSPYYRALISLALGDKEEAMDWLEKGYEQRAEWMIYLTIDPRLDELRQDYRFQVLVLRTGPIRY